VHFHFGRASQPEPAQIVALVRDGRDREMLSKIADREHLDIHFADTCGEAWSTANRLRPPVVLCERDVPGMEWQDTVRILASAEPHPCVILTSRIVDEYVWREIVSRGGYDVLARPLRNEDATRAIRLAMTYWKGTSNLRK
jgi:DNA-binding NtrC family response regulator